MEARGVVATAQSGLVTGPPTIGSPVCGHEDLGSRSHGFFLMTNSRPQNHNSLLTRVVLRN